MLLFFNARQHRVRDGIEATIERYGLPEIIERDRRLDIRVAGVPEVQTLFAVHEADGRARPVGVVIYVRESIERITVLHVGVADDHTADGPYGSERVLTRLFQQIRGVARRTQGIRHMAVAYHGTEWRVAHA